MPPTNVALLHVKVKTSKPAGQGVLPLPPPLGVRPVSRDVGVRPELQTWKAVER